MAALATSIGNSPTPDDVAMHEPVAAATEAAAVPRTRGKRTLNVAVVGCAHGELDAIYTAVREIEQVKSLSVDLVICPGDFQSVRNARDLRSMACPDKYKHMRDFWRYYAGKMRAPVPTLFVGGNHEASNHLQEMPLGGLAAPNMYFLGQAGVISFRGLRVAGVSGVYVAHGFERARAERPPYRGNQVKTVYHARATDATRLMRLRRKVDVCVSHDWPRGIVQCGDLRALLARKPFLAGDVGDGSLGNPATMRLLRALRPRFWFAAHMHVKFAAVVRHDGADCDGGGRDGESGEQQCTKFLALDKVCRPRDFMQLLQIEVEGDGGDGGEDAQETEHPIKLDAEWLTILRTEAAGKGLAGDGGRGKAVSDEEMAETIAVLEREGAKLAVRPVSDFEQRGAAHGGGREGGGGDDELRVEANNMALMRALGLDGGAGGGSGGGGGGRGGAGEGERSGGDGGAEATAEASKEL